MILPTCVYVLFQGPTNSHIDSQFELVLHQWSSYQPNAVDLPTKRLQSSSRMQQAQILDGHLPQPSTNLYYLNSSVSKRHLSSLTLLLVTFPCNRKEPLQT